MKIKISADSTCDLPQSILEQYNIGITPLYIVRDGVDLVDGVDITPEDIYNHVAAGGDICSTAAVSVADYIKFFEAQRQEYDAVVHFCISSEMSCCYQNACIAAEEVEGIYPIDSRNLSSGIGQLVIEAAVLAQQGELDAAAIADAVNAKKAKLDVSFVLDTLAYLHKGGRCSAVAAFGANVLGLKPCIEVHDGKMGVGKKYRGKLQKCMLQYIRERLEGRDDIETDRIFLTDSRGLTDEELDELEQEILRCQPFQQVLRSKSGCTISNHCGPRCMGILFFHK